MKKQPLSLLLVITILFCVFTLGFFLGRNQNHETVRISVLPSEARHDLPPETAVTEPAQSDIAFPININSAGIEELTAIPGIGPTLARRILDFRTRNGSFETPEELLNVEGIGSGKLEAILDYIITGG